MFSSWNPKKPFPFSQEGLASGADSLHTWWSTLPDRYGVLEEPLLRTPEEADERIVHRSRHPRGSEPAEEHYIGSIYGSQEFYPPRPILVPPLRITQTGFSLYIPDENCAEWDNVSICRGNKW